jgi:quercetin dioxygenase-like cupin family protein
MKIVDESKITEGEYTTRWLVGPWNSQSKNLEFGIAIFQPNQRVKKHFHEQVEEIFYVIEGEIRLLINNTEEYPLKKGFVAHIPAKQVHALYNPSKMISKLVIVKSPSLPADKKFLD